MGGLGKLEELGMVVGRVWGGTGEGPEVGIGTGEGWCKGGDGGGHVKVGSGQVERGSWPG